MKSRLISSVLSLSMQGSAKTACDFLRKVSTRKLTEPELKFRSKFLNRFESNTPSKLPRLGITSLDQVISSYVQYWHFVLTNPKQSKNAENKLKANLCNTLELGPTSNFETIERCIKKLFLGYGYHTLLGVTSPYRELQIWESETEKSFHVSLPETTQDVSVVLMKSFVLKGWLAYATLGKKFASGWAKKDKLYCNTSAWKPGTESFRVSFLVHEAQHFSDYKRFPRLVQADLEYRAKLAEISVSQSTTMRLIKLFQSLSANNPKVPHAYANWIITKSLIKSGTKKNPSKLVTQLASGLLKEHSAELRKKGPRVTKGVVLSWK